MCPTICGIGGMMINNGSGCKFNRGTMMIHGTSMGLWLPALEINRITVGISGIAGMPMIGINGHLGLHVVFDDGWSSRSQWHSEPKKYSDKSPPPEWDGNHPEKTWRDYRRTLKQWLSTTDVPSERHGMLLWRALTGDAKLLISHFRDEDLLCWGAGQRIFERPGSGSSSISASLRTRMTLTMLSTNCTVSATRRYCSLRMWPGLPF